MKVFLILSSRVIEKDSKKIDEKGRVGAGIKSVLLVHFGFGTIDSFLVCLIWQKLSALCILHDQKNILNQFYKQTAGGKS